MSTTPSQHDATPPQDPPAGALDPAPARRSPHTLGRVTAHRLRTMRRPVVHYARKFAGARGKPPPRPALWHTLVSWLGACVAIGVLGYLTEKANASLMLASFGASSVLLFGYPESPFSQPRNTIGGHLIAATIGVAAYHIWGEYWLPMAIAVATAIAAMKLTRTVHPPAGSTAIIALHAHPQWSFIVLPTLIGSLCMVALAACYNNIVEHRRYPLYWW